MNTKYCSLLQKSAAKMAIEHHFFEVDSIDDAMTVYELLTRFHQNEMLSKKEIAVVHEIFGGEPIANDFLDITKESVDRIYKNHIDMTAGILLDLSSGIVRLQTSGDLSEHRTEWNLANICAFREGDDESNDYLKSVAVKAAIGHWLGKEHARVADVHYQTVCDKPGGNQNILHLSFEAFNAKNGRFYPEICQSISKIKNVLISSVEKYENQISNILRVIHRGLISDETSLDQLDISLMDYLSKMADSGASLLVEEMPRKKGIILSICEKYEVYDESYAETGEYLSKGISYQGHEISLNGLEVLLSSQKFVVPSSRIISGCKDWISKEVDMNLNNGKIKCVSIHIEKIFNENGVEVTGNSKDKIWAYVINNHIKNSKLSEKNVALEDVFSPEL